MEIAFHFTYSEPMEHRAVGGKYDGQSASFRWPLVALDDVKIEPFVSDPSFLCTTHLSVTVRQKQVVLGHAVISLFNVFPKSLVDTEKLKSEYMTASHKMDTMQDMEVASNSPPISNGKVAAVEIVNHKGFNAVISRDGVRVGELEGFISVDGKMIRNHIMYSAMDARKHAVAQTPPTPPSPGRMSGRLNLKINTHSMFNLFTGKKQKHSKNSDFARSPPVPSGPSRSVPAPQSALNPVSPTPTFGSFFK